MISDDLVLYEILPYLGFKEYFKSIRKELKSYVITLEIHNLVYYGGTCQYKISFKNKKYKLRTLNSELMSIRIYDINYRYYLYVTKTDQLFYCDNFSEKICKTIINNIFIKFDKSIKRPTIKPVMIMTEPNPNFDRHVSFIALQKLIIDFFKRRNMVGEY
jgi:hypothetical protein